MCYRTWALAIALLAVVAPGLTPLRAADHLDAPDLRQQGDGGRDINDVYVFQSPNNPANSVLVMTVNPFAGITNPFGTVSDTTFDPAVDYEFLVDNNGDAIADVTYSTKFGMVNAGSQSLTTMRNGMAVATGNTGSTASVNGGGMLQASLYDDPFFFDLVGFNNGFNFTGTNTFAGANVSAIVLEVPSAELQNGANTNIGVWARTTVGGVQQDRMGRPAINTAVIPSSRKDEFNLGMPSTDFATFGGSATTTIQSLNGNDAVHAGQIAAALLPDLITFDTSSSAGFLNGRQLADDVIDAELGLLSKNAVTTDMVNSNDRDFLTQFPYLAAPNPVPEPSTMVLLALGAGCLVWSRSRR